MISNLKAIKGEGTFLILSNDMKSFVVIVSVLVSVCFAAPPNFIAEITDDEWAAFDQRVDRLLNGDETVGNPDEIGPYFESDIILTEAQKIEMSGLARNGVVNPMIRWPGGRLPYVLDPTVPENYTTRLQAGIDTIFDGTNGCIKIVPKEVTDRNYVYISGIEDIGCFSYIGVVGGMQFMNFPEWCMNRNASVVHEFFHALGFYHMQSDLERDDHVIINWEHIRDGAESNFYIQENTDKYDTEYDYESMMHYSKYAFSKDGNITITTKNPDMQDVIGQRVRVTDSDFAKVREMYIEAGECQR